MGSASLAAVDSIAQYPRQPVSAPCGAIHIKIARLKQSTTRPSVPQSRRARANAKVRSVVGIRLPFPTTQKQALIAVGVSKLSRTACAVGAMGHAFRADHSQRQTWVLRNILDERPGRDTRRSLLVRVRFLGGTVFSRSLIKAGELGCRFDGSADRQRKTRLPQERQDRQDARAAAY